MTRKAFLAYPDGYPIIGEAIEGAVSKSRGRDLELLPWKTMQTIGFKLDEQVRFELAAATFLIADITYPNTNVFYEIGYAIGLSKAVIPTVHHGIEKAVQRIVGIGLFDTLSWLTYENAEHLIDALQQLPLTTWASSHTRRKNHSQPLFILDTQIKTDFRNQIFHSVENSLVKFRVFDPTEIPRLTAAHAIAEVSSSAGVIITLLTKDIRDAEYNNLRASFILGLCHGFDVKVMAIQNGNGPAPPDYRDFVTNSTFNRETDKHISGFAAEVLIWNQQSSPRDRSAHATLLNAIDLGSPMAENETQRLNEYFIETAAFARASRAEGAVVIGRKGSGKSAIFQQIVEVLLKKRKTCIVDLRPASHNLSEMRESILKVVSAGIFDHTIAAFWQYTIHMEILLKLREAALAKAKNNFQLQERIRNVEIAFSFDESVVSGDFTSRLRTAIDGVIQVVGQSPDSDDVRRRVTNTMFESFIPRLRDEIVGFSDICDEIVVLIDDLDKGWPPRRVESQDVTMVKHLIEGLNRIQRDLSRRKVNFRHLLFLRSDIYEKLVQETSDRGKYNLIRVDWSDPLQLRHLIRERVVNAVDFDKQGEAWEAVNPMRPAGDTLTYLIDNSLRRPRFLIDLCERTISCAMNRGHEVVEEDDVEEGLRQMSLYLVSDFAYEMRDVSGAPEDILYSFVGASQFLSESEISVLLQDKELGVTVSEAIDLLLWYGFLGFLVASVNTLFIYDVEYDFRRLDAERARLKGDLIYVVNSAFMKGLDRAT